MIRQPILVFAVVLTAQVAHAQSAYKVTVRDQETKEPVAGATVTVKGTEVTATTDAAGVAQLAGAPEGAQGRRLVARQSLAFFNREIEIPDYRFDGNQFNSYTDLSYFHPVRSHALVFGFNAAYDRFREGRGGSPVPRDETRRTFGGYVQDSFNVTDKLLLEAGFRLDHVRDYGAFALPRVSALYRFTDRLSSRFTVGFGYKAPSVFTEEAETLLFQGVLPVGNFGEKTFGEYSLFFNAENITDTRQGRFGAVVLGPHQRPTFSEIYTHTEGRVFNGGIKVRL